MRRSLVRRLSTVAVMLGCAAILPGCASSREARTVDQDAETFVRVDNRSMLDMTVYVLRGTERRRLGLVNALSTQTLEIPRVLVQGSGVLRFLADPIGSGRTPTSEEISVRPGDVVQLMIPPH
jgi:hypothetical protein